MTDVHFHPQRELAVVERPVAVIERPVGVVGLEQAEMAAFEKGRMQGEMEAIRRMEAEAPLKTFNNEQQLQAMPVQTVMHPDVLEINRLTYLQKAAAYIGEAAAIAYIIITVVWLDMYRGDVGWSNDDSGDNIGNVGMWNTHLLTNALGLFFLSQAILMYRVLPLNLHPWMNRAIYTFNYSAAIVCFIISLVGMVKSTPEATFWAVDNWCFGLALAVCVLHGIYSMVRTMIDPLRPVSYEKWAEVNNQLTNAESPEQRRDHSAYNAAGRTVYTPAPVYVARTSSTIPPASSNVGAQVPVAPANAPRWTENPNTHAEDYFLMPRAKWGVCGFFAMGAAILMDLSAVEHILAANRQNWSQGPQDPSGKSMNEVGNEAGLVGALGLCILASVLLIAYAAMPPRTTLVKNGILTEQRRSSISHNAETRLGNNIV